MLGGRHIGTLSSGAILDLLLHMKLDASFSFISTTKQLCYSKPDNRFQVKIARLNNIIALFFGEFTCLRFKYLMYDISNYVILKI